MNKILLPIVCVLMLVSLGLLYVGIFSEEFFYFKIALTLSAIGAILVFFIKTERPNMEIANIPTVSIEQIIGDCPLINDLFNTSDLSVSFGDATATLVNQELFLALLDDCDLTLPDGETNAEQTPLDFELKRVYNRLDKLGDSILINLGS